WEREWMIFGMLSFPTPLSPVTRTEISVGATWIAFSTARFSFGSFPRMPKRCLVACTDSMQRSHLGRIYYSLAAIETHQAPAAVLFLIIVTVTHCLPDQGGAGTLG